jgi:hypothetical protein
VSVANTTNVVAAVGLSTVMHGELGTASVLSKSDYDAEIARSCSSRPVFRYKELVKVGAA